MAINLALGDTRLIIDTCKAHGLLRNQAAYVLATSYHETAHTMKPVREMGGEKYLKSKRYYPYVGMGYVQLTWLANYEKAGKKLGVDFVSDPRLLLKAEHAAPILVIGMKEGWFTGKKLSDYITLKASDFKGARRIINGTDKAALIAGHAVTYDRLLKAEGYGETHTAKATEMAKPQALLGEVLAGAVIDKVLDRALEKVVKSPSIPVTKKEAEAVKQVVKAEMVEEGVQREQFQTNTEPAHRSYAVTGGLLSFVSAATVAYNALSDGYQPASDNDLILPVVGIVLGFAWQMYGRYFRTKPIGA